MEFFTFDRIALLIGLALGLIGSWRTISRWAARKLNIGQSAARAWRQRRIEKARKMADSPSALVAHVGLELFSAALYFLLGAMAVLALNHYELPSNPQLRALLSLLLGHLVGFIPGRLLITLRDVYRVAMGFEDPEFARTKFPTF